MKIWIVTKIKEPFNAKLYGSVKSIHSHENITKNNLKMSHRALLGVLKGKESWGNQEIQIKKEEIIRTKNKN